MANRGQTRASALEIQRRLEREGHQVACLTGEFEGHQRDMIIDAFRDGKAKVLITTNVLARGIDVQTVSLVINYVSHQASAPKFDRKYSMRLGCPARRQPQTRPSDIFASDWAYRPLRTRRCLYQLNIRPQGLPSSQGDCRVLPHHLATSR